MFILKNEKDLYFNNEYLFTIERSKSNYILRTKSIINAWNYYKDDAILFNELYNAIKSQDINNINKFVDFYIAHILNNNISKLKEQEQLKHISFLVSIYVIICYDKENSCIYSGIDYVLRKFPLIYKKIFELLSKYQVKYKEVINKLEQHSISNTAELEIYSTIRDLFVSALMEEKYLFKEFSFGLINNIFARLFMIIGSKKAYNDASYRDINYDYITFKISDLHDIIIINDTMNKLNKITNNKVLTNKNGDIIAYNLNNTEITKYLNQKLNLTFITYIALPYLNKVSNLYLTKHLISDNMILFLLDDYLHINHNLKVLFENMAFIEGPEINIYDDLTSLKNSICGIYFDFKNKVLYYNDINKGFHTLRIRTIQTIYPEFKQLFIEYSTEPHIIQQILAILIYTYYYLNKKQIQNIMYHFIKLIR